MAKKITDEHLTPEFYEKLNNLKDEVLKGLYDKSEYRNWKPEFTEAYIKKIYEVAEEKEPVVVIANNIKEYCIYYNLLFNEKLNNLEVNCVNILFTLDNFGFEETKKQILADNDNPELISKFNFDINKYTEADTAKIREFYSNKLNSLLKETNIESIKSQFTSPSINQFYLASEYSRIYLAWFKILDEMYDLELDPKSKEDFEFFYSYITKNNISKSYLCERVALILRMPEKIITTKQMNGDTEEEIFHSVTEGAIQYPNENYYFINNREIEAKYFEAYHNKTLTFEDFQKETNEDIKAAIITLIKENEGNEGVLKFLGATLVDEKKVDHANGYSEELKLYKTKETFSYVMNSKGDFDQPYAWLSMVCPSTGQNYLIDTCPTFTDAVEAAKWHRPKNIPMDIPYVWQSAN